MSFTPTLFKQVTDAIGPELVRTRDGFPPDIRECVGEISASMTADVEVADLGTQRIRVTVTIDPQDDMEAA